jgi:serine/threonine protein phosphatase PrpC
VSLRIVEHAERTDPGRARRGNEDSYWTSPPFFVVADGMGGAQAGEVASRTAVETFSAEIPEEGDPEERLTAAVLAANGRIHELSRLDRTRAGMGTTLIAVLVGGADVHLAHVGDSRIYRLRHETLTPLTRDHTLVQVLIDQGRISEEEAATHPQRSVITRALGPEPHVEVETRTLPARDADVFLLCSDGLTSMVDEATIERILVRAPSLDAAAGALVDAANAAGGRDNITVVLLRLADDEHPSVPGEDTQVFDAAAAAGATGEPATAAHATAGQTPAPPAPAARIPPRREPGARQKPRSRARTILKRAAVVLVILVPVAVGLWVGSRAVYFLGTDSHGLVAVYRGVPYDLPAGIRLYEKFYVSGVPASTLSAARREDLLDHSLRSERDASDLVDQLELGKVSK